MVQDVTEHLTHPVMAVRHGIGVPIRA